MGIFSIDYLKGKEDERTKMSMDLHDGLGQYFMGIKMKLQVLENQESIDKRKVREILRDFDDLYFEYKCIIHDLKPPGIENGLARGIQTLLLKTEQLFGTETCFESNVTDFKFEQEKKIEIYRILQELVTNSVKHGKASIVHIKMNDTDDDISVELINNGKTKLVESTSNKQNHLSGLGWESIRKRLNFLNGSISKSPNENGAKVFIKIPKN